MTTVTLTGTCQARIVNRLHPSRSYDCTGEPVFEFTARCRCNHVIRGAACIPCIESATAGCLNCWEHPRGRRHKCGVEITLQDGESNG